MAWLDTIVQGVLLGGLYALFATGLSLIFGVMRLVNLAHGDFSILAAFLAVVAVQALGLNPLLALLWWCPLMAAARLRAAAAACSTGLLGRGILPAVLVTFGLSIVIQNGLLETFSADSQRLTPGGIETASLPLAAASPSAGSRSLTFAVAVLLLVGLQLLIGRTRARPRVPRGLRRPRDGGAHGHRQRPRSTRSRWRCRWPSWRSPASSSASGRRSRSASGPDRLLFAFEAVIIGGLGSLWGTLVGGVILGVAQTIGARISPGWGVLAGHLVFLAVLLAAARRPVRAIAARRL